MKNNFSKLNFSRTADVYKLISKIRSVNKRNLLRGYIAKESLLNQDINTIRAGNTSHDSAIVGALLKGPHGLRETSKKRKKRTSDDLFVMTGFPPITWRNEVSYTAGYINSMSDMVFEMLLAIKNLVYLERLDSEFALDLMLKMCQKYGASNYVSYKLAYIRSARDLSPAALFIVTQIENEIEHQKNAGMHFSALENLSSKISLFGVAQRRISGLVERVNGDFRKALSLSNFVPTPLNETDVAGFLLRATESSLIDAIYSTLIIFNLSEDFDSIKREFELHLSTEIFNQMQSMQQFADQPDEDNIVTDHYMSHDIESDTTLNMYRVSSAFLERKKFARFRSQLDRIIGARLLAEIIGDKIFLDSDSLNSKSVLLLNDGSLLSDNIPIKLDTFYRTFLFLKFIKNKSNILQLSKDEIKFVFENTLSLDVLLTEEEINTLYLTASEETKSLVAVLAMALFRSKSIDPDIDFEFRSDFISHVNSQHHGSIIEFIEYLLKDSPAVANYIAVSLDEVTLEKLYTLVKNASEAAKIRVDILRAVGERLNRIEYIIEADAIDTRSKLSALERYFDSSRMYVDSVSMKKWLDSNPTIYTEQYRSLYPKNQALIASINAGLQAEPGLILFGISDQDEYLLSQISKDAFEQFCLNTEFGIQSYLGRRIRHNTLDGVTTDTVDAVFRKSEYSILMSNTNLRKTVDAWTSAYKALIDKLRRDYLQFKSSGSFFNAILDLEEVTTQDNIRKLSNSLRTAGASELLNDLVIAFCWQQITPQLEHAARYIRTTLLKEASATIDKYFSGSFGVIESQIKADLHQAVNEVLRKVADWFQVPQTGFISATVRELCQIILIELHRNNQVEYIGDALENKYTGISVHRLYDCLAVLLKNAQKHGDKNRKILIDVNSNQVDANSVLDLVSIDITSTVSGSAFTPSYERISSAIQSKEAVTDMVTEGYTGIKKIKIITRASEGSHTVRLSADEASGGLTIGFSMHVEVSTESITAEIES